MSWIFALWATSAAASDCLGPPTSPEDVVGAIDRALTGFSEGYEDRFNAGWLDATNNVGCLDAPITPALASSFIQIAALHAFAQGDRAAAMSTMRSALTLDPDLSFPDTIAPANGPIDRLVVAARATEPPAVVPIDAQSYAVYVNGARMQFRPDGAPAIVQFVRTDGSVRWSGVVWDAAGLPTLEADATRVTRPPVAVATPDPDEREPLPIEPPPPDPRDGWAGPNVPLLASAGGVAALGGGLLIAGVLSRSGWSSAVDACLTQGCDSTVDELEARRNRANSLGYAGQGSLAVAAGLGVASITVSF
jgi:hypothetical protein